MFKKLVVTLRAISFGFSNARRERNLDLLARSERDSEQERVARRLETQLFFDRELLDQARSKLKLPCNRQLLASLAGILLVTAPYVSYAEAGGAGSSAETDDTSGSGDQDSLMEQIERWLEDMLTQNSGNQGDPEEGEG